MTIWDNIYKKYQKGETNWATLSEGIDQRFIDFIEITDFELKSAFDIGCGTGKYLKYLQEKDFEVAGIDSSETAVNMTKELLGNNADIQLADMFSFDLPKSKYGLVISVSTLHHGTKYKIQKLIEKIFESLAVDGKVFITLPDLECNKKWNTFKSDKEIAPGTYSPLSGPEKGLPHSFFTKEEINELFKDFSKLQLSIDDIGRWFVIGKK